jgi:hypothetical protein
MWVDTEAPRALGGFWAVEVFGAFAASGVFGVFAARSAMASALQVPWHLSRAEEEEAAMPTAAHSPYPTPETRDPDDALGAQESQVAATAPVEGRPSPEQIAREAYLIYLANGSQDGRHDEDWYEAERRLGLSPGARQSGSTPQQTAAQLDDVDTRDRTPG